MRKSFDPYMYVTHAAMHCLFGSGTDERTPDKADTDAAAILWSVRRLLPGGRYLLFPPHGTSSISAAKS